MNLNPLLSGTKLYYGGKLQNCPKNVLEFTPICTKMSATPSKTYMKNKRKFRFADENVPEKVPEKILRGLKVLEKSPWHSLVHGSVH